MKRFISLPGILACWLILASLAVSAEMTPGGSEASPPLNFLRQQLKVAKQNPNDVAMLKKLYAKFIKLNDDELGDPLAHAIAFGLLYNGNVKTFMKMRVKLRKVYRDGMHRSLLKKSSYSVVCSKCHGKRKMPVACTKCNGTGKCPNTICKEGQLSYEIGAKTITKKCPTCGGSGKCPNCKGTGKVNAPCDQCGGSGRELSKPRAKELFLSLVNETLGVIDIKEERFARLRKLRGNSDGSSDQLNSTGNQITPERLKQPLAKFGQWLILQQRSIGNKIVLKIYAQAIDGEAILTMVMHDNYRIQNHGWRLQIAQSFYQSWGVKCRQDSKLRKILVPGICLLDAKGKEIGGSRGPRGVIWVEK